MGITKRKKMKLRKLKSKKIAKPTKLSPMQIVKRDFGSKKDLAAKVINVVEKRYEESDEEFKARIETLSNTKLLKLYRVGQEVAEKFETKENLAKEVYKKIRGEEQKVDQDYLNKLNTFSMAKLLDMHKFYKRDANKSRGPKKSRKRKLRSNNSFKRNFLKKNK